jgi:hypothetical protein
MEKIDYSEIWLTAQSYLQTINLLQQINLLLENPVNLFIIWFPDHADIAEVLLSLIALRDT